MKVIVKDYVTNLYYQGHYNLKSPVFTSCKHNAKVYDSVREAKWVLGMIKRDCKGKRLCYQVLSSKAKGYGIYNGSK